MKKLAIVISHPVQYYSKVFALLNKQFSVKVFYTAGGPDKFAYDIGFDRAITWDIPLLEGYDYIFSRNSAKKAGLDHFRGIKNPDLIDEIRQFAPSALLVYGWAYQSHLKVMRHFKGKVAVFFRGDSTLLDTNAVSLKNICRTYFLRWVYSYIDKAFYVGTANKAYFKTMGLSNKKLVHAPHSVDNDRFAQDRKEESKVLRTKLNVHKNETLILYAGKFEPKKNPKLLLKVFSELNHYKTHLLFIGNGVLESDLKQMASISLAKDRIHFMDFQNQSMMPIAYQACDLFCLPSRGPAETWGLAVNEAMAAGKAILVSDKVGCSNDLISMGKNGYIFESESATNFRETLELILNQDLAEMGRYSQIIIKNWSTEKQVAAIINCIDSK